MERNRFVKSGKSFYILMGLILFQGISGIFGGGALILDSSGAILQMPLSMLRGSPFETFLVPGIILFFVLGIFPLIVFSGLWKKKSWAWSGALLISIALIIWINVEIALVGYHSEPPLQLVYGLVGVALLLFTLMSSVRYRLRSDAFHAKK